MEHSYCNWSYQHKLSIKCWIQRDIVKTDISNHFPIFFIFKCVVDITEAREEFIYKQNYSGNSIETFKQKLREVNLNEIKQSNNGNESYAKFSEICTSLYEEYFPKLKIRLNQRKNLSPWIRKGMNQTSKSSGADEINFNVIKHCLWELCVPLKYLFDSSLQSGVFSDLMKMAVVFSVFKTGDTADISNYR